MYKAVGDARASEFIVSSSVLICSLVTLYGIRTDAVWARRVAIAFVFFLMVGIVSEIPNKGVSDWDVWLFFGLAGAMIAALFNASVRGVSRSL